MSKKRILVVDDEPSITRLLKLNLEQTGSGIDGRRQSSSISQSLWLPNEPVEVLVIEDWFVFKSLSVDNTSLLLD